MYFSEPSILDVHISAGWLELVLKSPPPPITIKPSSGLVIAKVHATRTIHIVLAFIDNKRLIYTNYILKKIPVDTTCIS
jgi:hypothetical protein